MAPWQIHPIRNQIWVHVAEFSIMGGLGGLIPPPPPAKTLTNPLMFPQVPSHYFAPKMLILFFLCSFWLFWRKVPQTVDHRWKLLCGCMLRMLMSTINAAF